MKKGKEIILCMAMSFVLLLSGCQKTPDKSSVTSKADGLSEELYMPQTDTKEVFQRVKDRIDHKEGLYADPSLGPFSNLENSLNDAVELEPAESPKDQKADCPILRHSAITPILQTTASLYGKRERITTI